METKGAFNKRGRTRQRAQPEQVEVRVPVAFTQHLGYGDAAFILVEVLRHVLFLRGQLPMPFQQLIKVLDEREERDNVSLKEKAAEAAAAAAAAAVAASASDAGASACGGEGRGGGGEGGGGDATGVGRTGSASKSRSKKAKSGRPLAKASAHRRARKCLGVLAETTVAVEEAFADAARKGRPVLEALILLGASHLSPREMYSVTYSEPLHGRSPEGGDTASNNNGRGKSNLADAYSRKVVRSLVGGMSSVSFREHGACRVHLFLRVADGPVRELSSVPAGSKTVIEAAAPLSVVPMDNTESRSRPSSSSNNHVLADVPRNMRAQVGLPPAPDASISTLERLTPRPGFKIRVSRSRPASKVSVVLSKRLPAPPNLIEHSQNTGASGAGSVSDAQGGQQHQPNSLARGAGQRSKAVKERRGQKAMDEDGEGGIERNGADEERVREQQQQQQEHQRRRGMWHQLVSARLAGLKGCDSLGAEFSQVCGASAGGATSRTVG